MFKRFFLATISILTVVGLLGCVPIISQASVVNIARINTFLKEDGSGHNEFFLIKPANCPINVDLQPALEAIPGPISPSVIPYSSGGNKGFQVNYEFQST